MVPGRDERVREPREQAAAVVADRRGLAVHLCLRARDGGAECLPDRLVAEADAEDRRGGAEAPDHLEGDSRLVGVAGTRRDDDALGCPREDAREVDGVVAQHLEPGAELRSEEHTSELQSQSNLVCRLLLEKKKRHTLVQRRHEVNNSNLNSLSFSISTLASLRSSVHLPR